MTDCDNNSIITSTATAHKDTAISATCNNSDIIKETIHGFPDAVTAVTTVTNEKESIEKDNSNSCLSYRYTPEQIEEFYASNNGQEEEEHPYEESIYRPLISKQIHKLFFYYCKICPKVEFLSLESIEHHVKFKD
ncbi:MAG TPA: hypothetical protein VN703_00760 [Candidatus Sulfopaludibacter sp.]|jgi:hypothetical protein|nr:hypothetical protein [Candidatus Sulfopaludibacter sp.]